MNMKFETIKPVPPMTPITRTQHTPLMTGMERELWIGGRALKPAIRKMLAPSWTKDARNPISLL
jgi:hypothetical protein